MLGTRKIHIKANKHAHQISLHCKRILLIFLAHSEFVNSFILVRIYEIFFFILIVLKVYVKICKGSVLLTHKNTFMWLIKWIMCPWWMYEARKLIFHLILFCNQQISKRILSSNLFSTRNSYVSVVLLLLLLLLLLLINFCGF